MTKEALRDGRGLAKLKEFIAAQGGNPDVIDDYSLFPAHSMKKELVADRDGYVQKIEARRIGLASQHTGAGRATKEDTVDLSAGIYVCKKVGDEVKKGDVLAILYGNDRNKLEAAEGEALRAFELGEQQAKPPVLIKKIIGL